MIAWWLLACGGVAPGGPAGAALPAVTLAEGLHVERPLSMARDIQPIIDANCNIECHTVEISSLPMEPENAYTNLFDVPAVEMPLMDRVDPGAPEMSYLMHKLWGSFQEVGGMGSQMPNGADPLPAETLARIELWILQGAPP